MKKLFGFLLCGKPGRPARFCLLRPFTLYRANGRAARLFALLCIACLFMGVAGCAVRGGVFDLCAAYPNSHSDVDRIVLDIRESPLLSASDIKEICLDRGGLLLLLKDTGVKKLSSLDRPADAYLVFRSNSENLASVKYIDIDNVDLQQRISSILYAENDRLYLFCYDKKNKKAKTLEKQELDKLRAAARGAGIVWNEILSSKQKLAFYPADAADFAGPVSEAVITGPAVLRDPELDTLVYDPAALTLTLTAKDGSAGGSWKNFYNYDTCVMVIKGKAAHLASLVSGGIKIAKGYSVVRQGNTYALTYIRELQNENSKSEAQAAKEEIRQAMEALVAELESAGLTVKASDSSGKG